MNIIIKMTAVFLICGICFSKADNITFEKPPSLPTPWINFTEGVSLIVYLQEPTDNTQSDGTLEIYIKNIFKTTIGFNQNGVPGGITLFYIDKQGTKIPLHAEKPGMFDQIEKHLSEIPIKPDGVLHISINLSQEEFTLLKTNKCICSFPIYREPGAKGILVQTAPLFLTLIRK